MKSQGQVTGATLTIPAEAHVFSRHKMADILIRPAREPNAKTTVARATHPTAVLGNLISDGHASRDTQANNAIANPIDVGQTDPVNHSANADIGLMQELHRDRMAMVRAQTALTLQIKSLCRRLCGGDLKETAKLVKAMGKDPASHEFGCSALARCEPFLVAKDGIEQSRKGREKQIVKLAKSLPAYGFVALAPGLGPLSFAQIVAECGDLSNYSNPAKVWKRMGLAVFDGRAQRRVTGPDALVHGFSPVRRSIMWNIGECIVKVGRGTYRECYDARKAYEVERNPEIKKIAAHARAKRYAEKRLLRDLWRYWRDLSPKEHETNG